MTLTAQRKIERKGGIGGSDAAAALGLSPWKTQYKLWREKTGLDEEPDIGQLPHVQWGSLLEDVVAQKWATDSGMRVQRINTLLRSPEFPWMIANIDRAVVNPAIAGRVAWNGKRLTTDRILEVKTSLSGWTDDVWGEEGSDEVPQHYLIQAMHYLIVTGVEFCPFGLLLAGPSFRRYQVARHREVIDMIVDGERGFWRMVENNTPPPVTTAGDVRLRYPLDTVPQIEATSEIVGAVERYRSYKLAEKKLEPAIEEEKLAIQMFMGDAGTLTVRGVPVLTWKAGASNHFDVTRLKADMPGMYDEYMKRGTARRMLLKGETS